MTVPEPAFAVPLLLRFARLVVGSLAAGDLRVTPLAFYGLIIGLGPADWFAAFFVNNLPICLGYYFLIRKLS